MPDRAKELFDRLVSEGESAINEFIAEAASEELFLDFKRSANNGGGPRIHQDDRNNLAKAVSGFGNSEGGTIVWGVECSPTKSSGDVASGKKLIRNPTRFKSWLEGVVSGLTVPAHGGIIHHVIPDSDDTGYVVTLVPMSNQAPLQTVYNKRYYMRAGSSFEPVPHAVLAGMFGRRPHPRVFHNFVLTLPKRLNKTQISYTIGLVLRSVGLGIANDIYFSLLFQKKGGPNCTIAPSQPAPDVWFSQFTFGLEFGSITQGGIKLPPGTSITPTNITMILDPPFTEPIKITGSCGCAGAAPYDIDIDIPPEAIVAVYTEFIKAPDRGGDVSKAARRFQNQIFAFIRKEKASNAAH